MDIDSAVLRLLSVEKEESGAEKWTQSAVMVCSGVSRPRSQAKSLPQKSYYWFSGTLKRKIVAQTISLLSFLAFCPLPFLSNDN